MPGEQLLWASVVVIERVMRGDFWGAGNVLLLDLGVGYITMFPL